jgi:hypothetical protein
VTRRELAAFLAGLVRDPNVRLSVVAGAFEEVPGPPSPEDMPPTSVASGWSWPATAPSIGIPIDPRPRGRLRKAGGHAPP